MLYENSMLCTYFCLNYFLHIMKMCHNNETFLSVPMYRRFWKSLVSDSKIDNFSFSKEKYFVFFLHFETIFCLFAVSVEFYETFGISTEVVNKAVNREDKRSRRYRDRHFAKFERSRRYRDRYRC